MMDISIIIPAYNEEKRIVPTLNALFSFLEHHQSINKYEVLVVDDGSKDQTPNILKRFKDRVVVLRNDPNQGKGFSVKRGFLASSKEWALFTDIDLSTPLEEINNLWQFHRSQDLIFASRSMPERNADPESLDFPNRSKR